MTRSVHTTTASGDAITLAPGAHATAQSRTGRTVAQLEHNAMLALALVRATLHALERVATGTDRAALLLSNSRSLVDPAVKPELRRLFGELTDVVHSALWNGEPLLCGGGSAFAIDDPWREGSEPLCVELPDLQHTTQALVAVDLAGSTNALIVGQRNGALHSEVRHAQKRLGSTADQLRELLTMPRRAGHEAAPEPPARSQRAADEGFVSLIGRVRDHVLHAGSSALRVQGAPSTRAAWLIEGATDGH
ncbi:MAG: hypothetical protein ABW321_21555 [Polyangiales bacterium]